MSVVDYKTFVSKIRIKLIEDLSDSKIIQQWFDRIITLEFLQTRNIIPILKTYCKEEVINACKLENEYFEEVFNDNLEELENNFPNNFYSNDMILLLKKNINIDTKVEEISNFQEDFKDHERYTNIKILNRNLETKIDESNITTLTQIFTPNWICKYFASEIINNNIDCFQKIIILDPCLGTGQILIEVLNYLITLYQKNTSYSTIEIIEKIYNNQLYGFDIDEHAITLAKFIFILRAYELSDELLLRKNKIKLNFIQIKRYELNSENYIINNLLKLFEEASLQGSLIKVPNLDYNSLINQTNDLNEKNFLKMCLALNQKYDIVLTNPPYMGRKILPKKLLSYLNNAFQYGKSELYTAFIERSLQFLKKDGLLGMITLHTWMFIKSFANLRKYILECYQIEKFLHLGKNTFENLNAYNALASAFIIRNNKPEQDAFFVDLTKYDDIYQKEQALSKIENHYRISQKKLSILDYYQFLYWLNEVEYEHLLYSPKLAKYCEIRQGLATGNNQEYIRFWWEVNKNDIGFGYTSNSEFLLSGKKYAPYNKGGDQTKWYSTSKIVIKFNQENFEKLCQVGNHLPSRDFYFKDGITWSLFGFNSFNVRYKEQGYVFDVSGSSLFTKKKYQKYILAFLSSNVAFYFLSSIAPTVNFQVGNITSLPFVYDETRVNEINIIVEELIEKSIYLDQQDELSWNFEMNAILNNYNSNNSFTKNIETYCEKINSIKYEIREKEIRINQIFNDIYNLKIDPNVKKINAEIQKREIVKDLLSYLVGVVFNRFTIEGYPTRIDNKNFQNINCIILEIKGILIKYFSSSSIIEIEKILSYSVDDYYKKYFGREHINKYHHLPIYWYKKIDNNQFIGYYHTLKKDIIIDKEKGIKANYLLNDLLYKL